MAPMTPSGYNMYDMMSAMQKGIRRGKYDLAGFSANQLRTTFNQAMWNRILVISAEDCYGIITKEIVNLYERGGKEDIERAIALLCRTRKNRDACYFACNFILANRNPREVQVTEEEIEETRYLASYDLYGFLEDGKNVTSAKLIKSIKHRDMDEIGYYMNKLRINHRNLLWETLLYCSKEEMKQEILHLKLADDIVNGKKKDKDEIFISKALINILYANDEKDVRGCELINPDSYIEWDKHNIKSFEECVIKEIPEYVYDCHTLKGKRMGKTDWDMTRTEQEALFPLEKAYFDDASWIYTYTQDLADGLITSKGIQPILEYAKTHSPNPVEFIPY